MTQKFVHLPHNGWGLEHESLLEDNQEVLDTQERKLRTDILKVLRADAEYSRDEFEDVIEALQRLGVKNTRHFKHLQIEDLTGQGVPVVTARKLMDVFGDNTPKGTEDASQKKEPMSCWEKILAVVTNPTVLQVLGFVAEHLIRKFVFKF
ncbi:uncharacterized protein LOC144158528 [Haemaphysalis longicornis]